MNRKVLTLIPLLIVLYYFIHQYCDLFYFIDFFYVFKTWAFYTCTIGILILVGWRYYKSFFSLFIVQLSTILFLFLFFGSITDTLVEYKVVTPFVYVSLKKCFIFLALCGVVCWLFTKFNENTLKKLHLFWLSYCLLLIIHDITNSLISNYPERKYLLEAPSQTYQYKTNKKVPVFFLLFDMYPSDTVLKKYLGYDNVAIKEWLEQNNFYVTKNTKALYKETYACLASTLNLSPLSYYTDGSIPYYKRTLLCLQNCNAALVPAIFNNNSQNLKNYSVFQLANISSPLQFNLSYHLKNALTNTTFFNRVYNSFEPDWFTSKINTSLFKKPWSKKVEEDIIFLHNKFSNDLKNENIDGGFHYYHFMLPHPPMVFDSNGKKNNIKDMYSLSDRKRSVENFISAVGYANKTIQTTVDRLLKKYNKEVIILIQGDHGYREYADYYPKDVQLGAYNAIYLPNHHYVNFSDSSSHILMMQQVLTYLFESNK